MIEHAYGLGSPLGGVTIVADESVKEGEVHMHPRDYQELIGCRRPNANDGRICSLLRNARVLGELPKVKWE